MKHTSADKQLRMALTILVGIVFFGALTMLGGSVRAEEGADQFTIRLINHEFAPAAGLDPRARIELRLLLKELQKLGKTIIISSHILTELSDMCNSVGIIERGIMLTAGKIDDILADRAGGPVQQQKLFLKVLGAPDPAVTILRSLPDIGGVEIDRGLITFTFMQPIESNPGLLRELLNRNVPVVSLAPATQNLEDIFLNVTKGIIA